MNQLKLFQSDEVDTRFAQTIGKLSKTAGFTVLRDENISIQKSIEVLFPLEFNPLKIADELSKYYLVDYFNFNFAGYDINVREVDGTVFFNAKKIGKDWFRLESAKIGIEIFEWTSGLQWDKTQEAKIRKLIHTQLIALARVFEYRERLKSNSQIQKS